jgi:hypothetical protein
MNLSSFAVSVGLWPLIFAEIVGSKWTLFASPSLPVCRPLQLADALGALVVNRTDRAKEHNDAHPSDALAPALAPLCLAPCLVRTIRH